MRNGIAVLEVAVLMVIIALFVLGMVTFGLLINKANEDPLSKECQILEIILDILFVISLMLSEFLYLYYVLP